MNTKSESVFSAPGSRRRLSLALCLAMVYCVCGASVAWAQVGSMTVTTSPLAIAGQWRLDGGAWQNSGATLSGLLFGNHTIEYQTVPGWIAPATEIVDIVSSTPVQITRIYVAQSNSLSITLTPADVVAAGAQWRVDGGAWQSSGSIVYNLILGNHTVDYQNLPGWISPPSDTIVTVNGQSLQLTRNYMPQPGSLTITLLPVQAAVAGAQWRVDGGPWQNSGATVFSLSAGAHSVDYRSVAGWVGPPSETIAIANAQNTQLSRTFVPPNCALQVTLTPADAIAAGARWRVDAGPWQNSGSTVSGLSPGSHQIDYTPLTGWVNPNSDIVTLASGQTLQISRAYAFPPGSVTVTILPSEVIAAGAQWRIDAGPWQNSGTTVVGLRDGGHQVDYLPVAGWTAPLSETVVTVTGQSVQITRSYTLQAGALTIALTPAEAVVAGAQWRVDGGPWQASGAAVVGPAVGNHMVDYRAIAGWTAPPSETVVIASSQPVQLTRAYLPLPGSLIITLGPPAAVAAGGQWRVDGGSWQPSGATAAGLAPGSHTVEYYGVSGWSAPLTETVNVANTQATQLTRTYQPLPGSLIVTLGPPNAVPAGALWRVDSGAWQTSGATVAGLAPGTHALEYAAVAGWTSPPSETISIASGQSTQLTRSYTYVSPQLGSLTLALAPAAAVAAGAQWRIDGGAWLPSGTTAIGLAFGNHTVEYYSVAGWTAPATETIAISSVQLTQLSRTYLAPVGSLAVYLLPAEAAGAGAAWRIDGSDWQPSGSTAVSLTAGPHTLDYQTIGGWTAPPSETVTIASGQPTEISRTYTPSAPASLTVTLTPPAAVTAGAQWRVDGGAWQTSGATASGLLAGNHTIEYSQLSGWVAPNPDTLAFANGQTQVISRTYVQNAVPPVITVQPQSRSAAIGDTVSFSVVASGTAPLSYQWQMDGQPLVGETGQQLSIAQVGQNLSGAAFTVVVSNKAGSVTSQPAALLTVVASTARAAGYLPASYTPGVTLSVVVRVSTDATVTRYSLQDRPPAGWTISNVGQGGSVVGGQAQWPEFADANSRTLTYDVTPPANATGTATFVGSVVFNGTRTVAITGTRTIQAPLNPDTPRLAISIQRTPNLQASITLFGTPGKTYTIEMLQDVGFPGAPVQATANVTLSAASQTWLDPYPLNQPRRFYRAKLAP